MFLFSRDVIKLDIPMQSVVVCEVRNLGIAIIHHLRSKTEENASLTNHSVSSTWPRARGKAKAWFSYVGKIPDDRGFFFLLTVPDFARISDNRHKSIPETQCLCMIGDWCPAT